MRICNKIHDEFDVTITHSKNISLLPASAVLIIPFMAASSMTIHHLSITTAFFFVFEHFLISLRVSLFRDYSLNCNNYRKEGAVALIDALKHNTSLTRLECVEYFTYDLNIKPHLSLNCIHSFFRDTYCFANITCPLLFSTNPNHLV